jgi:membrane-bound serine protease (ClpP class)
VFDAAWLQQLVHILSSPLIAPLLLSAGVLGLIFEIKAGAFGLGGLVSVLSFGLFFAASFLSGHAGWQEVILLGLAMLSLAVEAFLLPGFGVTGVLGIGLLIGAVTFALMGAAPGGGDLLGALAVLGASFVITGAVFYAWLRHLPTSRRFAGLLHRESSHRAGGYIAAPLREELVGRGGLALTDLRPAGTASIEGERLDVVTEGEYVSAGSPVIVVRAEAYRHVVRRAPIEGQLKP